MAVQQLVLASVEKAKSVGFLKRFHARQTAVACAGRACHGHGRVDREPRRQRGIHSGGGVFENVRILTGLGLVDSGQERRVTSPDPVPGGRPIRYRGRVRLRGPAARQRVRQESSRLPAAVFDQHRIRHALVRQNQGNFPLIFLPRTNFYTNVRAIDLSNRSDKCERVNSGLLG